MVLYNYQSKENTSEIPFQAPTGKDYLPTYCRLENSLFTSHRHHAQNAF